MIEKECAKEVSELALDAVTKLTRILVVITDRCSADEYKKIKKGVGLSIGKIQTDILNDIFREYPEFSDLI